MKRLSPTALLSVAIAAFAVVLAAEAAWLRHEQQVAARAGAALRRKIQERDRLLGQVPALDAANEQAIANDLARARQALGEEQAKIPHDETGRLMEAAPQRTIEAFFDIARFVERSRAAAGAAKVALRPDERFGFATYANEGPADRLVQVYRQRLVGESLVEHLIGAHPRALLALRRETVDPGPPAARNQTEDYFVMDRALSVRRPGAVDTLAFRVEFSGQTATLRSFLTGIADLPQPLLVRSVEVEPLPAADPAAAASAAGTSVPLVRQHLSKFTVVVESVLLTSAPASPVLSTAVDVPTPRAPMAPAAAVWPKAMAQSAGEGWVYELFTPPAIYYNAEAHSFAVPSPDDFVREPEGVFGLQLVAVHLEPFRLQLAGYFGSPDDYVVAFTIPGSPGTMLARAGQHFDQLGLTLKSFEVRKVTVDHGDPWSVYDVAGLATLQDERSDTDVVLDTRTRKLTGIPLAVLQLPGQGQARELHEGDTWVDGSVTYRVERIQIEPAEVVVARTEPGRSRPEIKTMHPLATSDDRKNLASNGP